VLRRIAFWFGVIYPTVERLISWEVISATWPPVTVICCALVVWGYWQDDGKWPRFVSNLSIVATIVALLVWGYWPRVFREADVTKQTDNRVLLKRGAMVCGGSVTTDGNEIIVTWKHCLSQVAIEATYIGDRGSAYHPSMSAGNHLDLTHDGRTYRVTLLEEPKQFDQRMGGWQDSAVVNVVELRAK